MKINTQIENSTTKNFVALQNDICRRDPAGLDLR